jgi:hypothetical protein
VEQRGQFGGPQLFWGEGQLFGGGDGQSFFWQNISGFWAKYHVIRKEMKRLSTGMSVGEVMKGPPKKSALGP